MEERSLPCDHLGRAIQFGRTAADYDRFRPGFPASLFDQLLARGWIAPGLRALDLGTGTGALALGLAQRGLRVAALDPSSDLLEVARRRAAELDLDVRFFEAIAEDTGEPEAGFDLVSAGQCWWWFDAGAVIAETKRVLVAAGRLLIANFSYLSIPGSVAGRTEEIVLEHNPGWPKAGESGIFEEQLQALDAGGFQTVESFSYTEPVRFSHEAWRGRIRACNGVGAAMEPAAVEAFDQHLAEQLAGEFPGELVVPHRVFAATGLSPGWVENPNLTRKGKP